MDFISIIFVDVAKWKGIMKILQCKICGKDVKVDKRASQIKCNDCKRKRSTVKGTCPICNKDFTGTTQNQVYCSRKCWNLFQKERVNERRRYKLDCQFDFNLSDYPVEFDFELLKKYGMYSAYNRGNNLNGVSRDHLYSISKGFKNKIDCNIIKHPANCKLVIHSENNKKNDNCDITIEDLKDKIKSWDKKYGRVSNW